MKKIVVEGIFGLIGAVIGAFGGIKYGEYRQNEYVESQVAEIEGNDNTVIMNNVQDLIDGYNDLQKENDKVEAERDQYFEDYSKMIEENEGLKTQLNGSPIIELKDMGLCIEGSEANINKNNSYAIINGKEYFSKDILENIVDESTTSFIVQNDTIFLGSIVADSTSLLNQHIVDSMYYELKNNIADSYGNTHSTVGEFTYSAGYVYFNLNKKFSLLKMNISVDEGAGSKADCIITIMADDVVVYTSDSIDKVSANNIEIKDLSIDNCSVLKISCNGDHNAYPIIYDAFVYN